MKNMLICSGGLSRSAASEALDEDPVKFAMLTILKVVVCCACYTAHSFFPRPVLDKNDGSYSNNDADDIEDSQKCTAASIDQFSSASALSRL